MIRISRLADYGIVLLTAFAAGRSGSVRTARDLSATTRIPLPTVAKILKALAHGGVLVSHRGVRGGFSLARPPEDVSVADVIASLEGPIALTDCLGAEPGSCEHEPSCPTRSNWGRINAVVRSALENLTIAEMARPHFSFSIPALSRRPLSSHPLSSRTEAP